MPPCASAAAADSAAGLILPLLQQFLHCRSSSYSRLLIDIIDLGEPLGLAAIDCKLIGGLVKMHMQLLATLLNCLFWFDGRR